MAYAVVIEQNSEAPKVLVFNTLDEAQAAEAQLEAATEGVWNDDSEWHNFPRYPIKVSSLRVEMARIMFEVKQEKNNGS